MRVKWLKTAIGYKTDELYTLKIKELDKQGIHYIGTIEDCFRRDKQGNTKERCFAKYTVIAKQERNEVCEFSNLKDAKNWIVHSILEACDYESE